MPIEYKSFRAEVMAAMAAHKKEFCEAVGTLVVAEAQGLTPVLTGNLKKSETYEVMPDNAGVTVGVTPAAPYGIYVEKGTENQKAQPFLEPGAMNAIPKITDAAIRVYKQMGE
jgi:HK97 gp10 family phage protein